MGRPMGRLVAEEAFREKIIAHLRDVSSDSISGIARALSLGRDLPVHRLTVAGYLAAMAEMGMLREIAKPPSKHYQLANATAHRTLYERVGLAVREVPMPAERRTHVALATLVRLFGRPVFRAELVATRSPIPEDLPRVEVDDDKRRAILERINKRPHPRIEVPRNDPLLEAPEVGGPVDEVIRRTLLMATESEHLAVERRATQLALSDILEGP